MDQDKVETVWNKNREKKTANERLNKQFDVQQLLCFYKYS